MDMNILPQVTGPALTLHDPDGTETGRIRLSDTAVVNIVVGLLTHGGRPVWEHPLIRSKCAAVLEHSIAAAPPVETADRKTLKLLERAMRVPSWSPDTLDEIASIMRNAGYGNPEEEHAYRRSNLHVCAMHWVEGKKLPDGSTEMRPVMAPGDDGAEEFGIFQRDDGSLVDSFPTYGEADDYLDLIAREG